MKCSDIVMSSDTLIKQSSIIFEHTGLNFLALIYLKIEFCREYNMTLNKNIAVSKESLSIIFLKNELPT